jgi:hypothetical protein
MVMINSPASDASGWVRVANISTGVLPFSNGNSYIGTDSWKFKEIHSVNFYENGTALSSKYAAADHNHNSSYYTETEIDTKLTAKVAYGDVLMNTNPFGGKKLYISSIDNAMYAADKKWHVTITRHLISYNGETYPKLNPSYIGEYTVAGTGITRTVIESPAAADILVYVDDARYNQVDSPTTGNDYSYANGTLTFGKTITGTVRVYPNFTVPQYIDSPVASTAGSDQLFDGSYETGLDLASGYYMKVAVRGTEDGTGGFGGYPYGYYYLSYYNTYTPDKAEARVYNRNYRPHGIGWKKYDFTDYNNTNESGSYIQKCDVGGDYGRTIVEFIIYGHSTHMTRPTEIDWKLDRPDLNTTGATVTKYGTNKLYYDLWLGDRTTNKIKLHPYGSAEFAGNVDAASITVNNNAVWHAGNLTPSNYMPIGGGTFTGVVTFPGTGKWDTAGNLGIGNTSPGYKLDVTGDIRYSNQLRSTVTTGTAPMIIASTTKVSNLNVDRVDDFEAKDFFNGVIDIAGYGILSGCEVTGLGAAKGVNIGAGWVYIKDYGIKQITAQDISSGFLMTGYNVVFISGINSADSKYTQGNVGIVQSATSFTAAMSLIPANSIILAKVKPAVTSAISNSDITLARDFMPIRTDNGTKTIKILESDKENSTVSTGATTYLRASISKNADSVSLKLSTIPDVTGALKKINVEPDQITISTVDKDGVSTDSNITATKVTSWDDANAKKHTHYYGITVSSWSTDSHTATMNTAHTLPTNTRVYKNGLRQTLSKDYTLSANTVVFVVTVDTINDSVLIDYDL